MSGWRQPMEGKPSPDAERRGMATALPSLRSYAGQKCLSRPTLARWQAWAESDQHALLGLAHALQLGENQVRDFLDWLEEIALRDGGSIAAVLQRPEIRRPLQLRQSRNDKLRAVKAALRTLRYPRLARLERELHSGVAALALGHQVRIAFPPAFEGDEVTLEVRVKSAAELEAVLSRLRQRLTDGSFQHLFKLLDEA